MVKNECAWKTQVCWKVDIKLQRNENAMRTPLKENEELRPIEIKIKDNIKTTGKKSTS